ncbi:MAG: sigma-54 dependent transcriptional regulator [Bdellovibrionota bacterium]
MLFVDDDETSTTALIRSLIRHGADFPMELRTNGDEAVKFVRDHMPPAAVVDLSIDPERGPQSGLDLIGQLLSVNPNLRILVLTGQSSDDFGIRSLQCGAASFLRKPVDAQHLVALVRDALVFHSLRQKLSALQSDFERISSRSGLSSSSPKMQKAIESAAFAASHRQPVLLVGETGVGKGVFAQAIHRMGLLPSAPFLRFQPSFGTADLVSSELFGHQKGAFTGAVENRRGLIEEAHGGTLFIDEVDELPVETQILLLNVLQEKTFRRLGSNRDLRSDFRLIAATNRPVEESVRTKKLREDFYHRIAHFTLPIPALRERPEDISSLAHQFASQLINREDLNVQALSFEALQRLQNQPWHGNVRELQAAVEGAVYRAKYLSKRFVDSSDFTFGAAESGADPIHGSFRQQVEAFELRLIEDALSRCDQNQSKAAALLQLDRSTLRRVLARAKP